MIIDWILFEILVPISVLVGALLDLLLGDPAWLPHPVRWIGALIAYEERALRSGIKVKKRPPKKVARELRAAGRRLVFIVILTSGLICVAACVGLFLVHPLLGFAAFSVTNWFMLSARSLAQEADSIRTLLEEGSIPAARRTVGRIVGRDTHNLDEEGIARATIETVAENTSDGVVAPLLFMAVGGPLGGVIYKAINTMDSMVGYTSPRYLNFGRAAAKLDDAANFVPARLTAFFMVLAAGILRYDIHGAQVVWSRDRRKHESPNSAQSESACAGALGVRLGGGATYAGVWHERPYINAGGRPPEAEDIRKAARLLLATELLVLPFAIAISALVWFLILLLV
ncbi:MAG: adenosylcobinamide-phosphate synthase CbiB [Clostridiales Family XIII bacterium]|jgi:adenosylcobinamide-phosphate synthase|nr:adenosylcobinamide-phosphate synthase CbiB [Clostridiales Family XIII bacterium]